MKHAVIEERKRYAAAVAERDRVREQARLHARAHETTVVVDLVLVDRYKRWWLERYSMDEIREMAAALEPIHRAAA